MLSLLYLGLLSSYKAWANFVDYEGFQAVRVSTENHAERVSGVVKKLELDTWRQTTSFVDIVVPPSQLETFNNELADLDVEVLDQNLGRSIAAEHRDTFRDHAGKLGKPAVEVNGNWFNSYHSYKQHLKWLLLFEHEFPDNSEIMLSGLSFEGRPISGLHIWGDGGEDLRTRPAVVFHGTVHGREWITTMMVEYTAYALLTNYSANAGVRQLIDDYDFYLFPIVNPDGFVYTEHNRLWRRSRQPSNGSKCIGRDLNRNWPYMWDSEGSSSEPCSEIYRGEQAGDTPEIQGLMARLADITGWHDPGVKLYIDWHSYSQLLLWPYDYSAVDNSTNDDELRAVAEGAAEEIAKVHGTNYTVGPGGRTLYVASGTSIDYVHEVLGVNYSYGAELRDTGKHGFLLPKEEILPTCEESFAGVEFMLEKLRL